MSGYIGTQPVPQATQKRQAFTATAGQTTFATSGYSVGFVDVYMNGVKLAAADYTATNGSDVVLAVAAVVGDTLEIVAFTSFVASGGLAATNNLSDVASASTALTNLGVTSTAAELNKLTGATLSTAELNQLNAITRGSILYGNASGATARLAAGGASTVLTSDGTDLSWAAAAAGGSMEFIASSGALSNAADFAFTQFDSTKYCNYQFVLLNVKPATDAVNLQPQVRLAGTSNYDTGTNYVLNTTPAGAIQSSFYTALSVSNASSDVGVNGVFHLYNPSENAYTTGQFLAVYSNNSQSVKYQGAVGSAHVVAQITDAIRFRFSSGNIASGTILMYGIKKS